MTTDAFLLHLITQRLESHGSDGDWPDLLLASLDGDGALGIALQPAARIGSLIGICGGRSVGRLRAMFTIEGGRPCEVHLESKDDA